MRRMAAQPGQDLRYTTDQRRHVRISQEPNAAVALHPGDYTMHRTTRILCTIEDGRGTPCRATTHRKHDNPLITAAKRAVVQGSR